MFEIWQKIKPKGDPVMWFIIIILMIMGLLAVYSTTSWFSYASKVGSSTERILIQQLVLVLTGFIIMLVVHSLDYRLFLKLAVILLYISYILLVLTLLFGTKINDAKRWLFIPNTKISIQTSEVAKIALFVFITRFLAIKQDEIENFKKTVLPLGIHIALVCALIAPGNLSTALLIFISSMVILFIGRIKMKHIALISLLMVFTGLFMFTANMIMPKELKFMGRTETWIKRINSFENPFKQKDEFSVKTLEQKDYAQIAVATGGIWGKGPGQSTMKSLISQGYNDFIYAIINEEYGIWGALIVLILYLLFMFRAFRIIMKSPKASGALLAIGLSFSFCLQALIHMGVSTTLLPVTGLTLPFISKGGTSFIITCIAFGIIMSVSRFIEEESSINKNDT